MIVFTASNRNIIKNKVEKKKENHVFFLKNTLPDSNFNLRN